MQIAVSLLPQKSPFGGRSGSSFTEFAILHHHVSAVAQSTPSLTQQKAFQEFAFLIATMRVYNLQPHRKIPLNPKHGTFNSDQDTRCFTVELSACRWTNYVNVTLFLNTRK